MILYTTSHGFLSMLIGCRLLSSVTEKGLKGAEFYPCWGQAGRYFFLWHLFGVPQEFLEQYVNLPDAFELIWDGRYKEAMAGVTGILICREADQTRLLGSSLDSLYGFNKLGDLPIQRADDDLRRTRRAGKSFSKRIGSVPIRRAGLGAAGKMLPGEAWAIDTLEHLCMD